MQPQTLLACLVLLPLVGALLNAFVLKTAHVWVVCTVATAAVAVPFVLSCQLFLNSLLPGKTVVLDLFQWISVPLMTGKEFTVSFGLTCDRLSGLFLLVITGVGTLIHVYSGQYMRHEEKPSRFFVYLNLFIVSMLFLVLGSNMLVTFLGWEGVGVCSYLLIGYWYEDSKNSLAALKAFVVNRIGDVGFLIAIFLCYMVFKTIDYSEISVIILNATKAFLVQNSFEITLIGFSLLLAVTGKSAQIPLYIWLPDAMAGPTPVSALIHAATMVTSGIYLMTRMSTLFVLSPVVMVTVAVVGAATALFAATIGFAQTDIKKVLAYSTCSQLGYMVLGCGVGAFQYGVAHVITHAFFKACLFLAAGSVILAVHHEQDFNKMGGLAKKMPITAFCFVIATLAIIGFPGFSGFFSKDALLAMAWGGPFGHPLLWFVGWLTAGCTAFYMLRLTCLVFFGTSRVADPEHVHENNVVVTLPLIVLALLSALGGFFVLPEVFTGKPDVITSFLAPVLAPTQNILQATHPSTYPLSHTTELVLMGASVGIVLFAAVLAMKVYRVGPQGGEKFTKLWGGLYRLVLDKWRVDELYAVLFVAPFAALGRALYRFVHQLFLEGVVNGVPEILYTTTSVVSDGQSGMARNYLKFIFFSLIFLGMILFF